jgi:hypothetical protein
MAGAGRDGRRRVGHVPVAVLPELAADAGHLVGVANWHRTVADGYLLHPADLPKRRFGRSAPLSGAMLTRTLSLNGIQRRSTASIRRSTAR